MLSNDYKLPKTTEIADDNTVFEGPEKLLEIWFHNDVNSHSIRDVKEEDWVEILNLIQCQILSKIQNSFVDSYLLR